ncbi:MAG TPA: tetratricopeptide repeat protein [Thermoanaerobaculia bacterium]|nr:tetratricopeptide repeat protein [Thermoanaerobaculia bacterium]
MRKLSALALLLLVSAAAFAADTDKIVADARRAFEAGKFKEAAAKYLQAAATPDLTADQVSDFSLQAAWASYIGGDAPASRDALKKAFAARPDMEVLPEFYSQDFANLAGAVKSQTAPAPKADLEELKRSARERLAGGLAQDVVYDLKRVGETNDPEIHRLLAEAYDKLGKSAEADAERKRAEGAASGITTSSIGALPTSAPPPPAQAGPSDIAPLLASADEALGKKDWAAAAALAKDAQEKDPRSGAAHRVGGDAALGAGDTATAEREYIAAATLDPADAKAQIGQGRVADINHQPNTAAAHYRKALELDPKALSAALALGESLNEAGDKSAARQAFGRATEIAPGDAAARDRFAVFLAAENEPAAAIEQGMEAVKAAPDVAAYHAHLGRAYAAMKSAPEAERELREAVRLDEKDEASWVALGGVLKAAGKNADAADAYGHALALAPRDETAILGRATALADTGRWEDAEQLLKSAAAEMPGSAAIVHDLGVAEFRLGKWDAAVEALQKAAAAAPGSAETKAALARAVAVRDFLAAARPIAPAAP